MEEVGGTGMRWTSCYDAGELSVVIDGSEGRAFSVEIEPCRLWPPLRIDFDREGVPYLYPLIFREVPVIRYERGDGRLTIRIPLKTFEGFHRRGFPMRINIWNGTDGWVRREPWENRLLHRDYNPECAGWLIFEQEI